MGPNTFSSSHQSTLKSKTSIDLSFAKPISSCPHAPRLNENLNVPQLYHSFGREITKNTKNEIPSLRSTEENQSSEKKFTTGSRSSITPTSKKNSITSPSSRKNSTNVKNDDASATLSRDKDKLIVSSEGAHIIDQDSRKSISQNE